MIAPYWRSELIFGPTLQFVLVVDPLRLDLSRSQLSQIGVPGRRFLQVLEAHTLPGRSSYTQPRRRSLMVRQIVRRNDGDACIFTYLRRALASSRAPRKLQLLAPKPLKSLARSTVLAPLKSSASLRPPGPNDPVSQPEADNTRATMRFSGASLTRNPALMRKEPCGIRCARPRAPSVAAPRRRGSASERKSASL